MKTITRSKIKPRRKTHGIFGIKKYGYKTPKRNIGAFDMFRMLRSNIHDIDLIIKNHPNMNGLNILKQDMLDILNFKKK